jgi:putative endonuclease
MNPSDDLASLPVRPPPAPSPDSFFIYIILCAGGTFYVGSTNNVARRVQQHQSGRGAKHTNDNQVVRLVFVEGPFDRSAAIARERQLKGWGRAKKRALVMGKADSLRVLSKSRDGQGNF